MHGLCDSMESVGFMLAWRACRSKCVGNGNGPVLLPIILCVVVLCWCCADSLAEMLRGVCSSCRRVWLVLEWRVLCFCCTRCEFERVLGEGGFP